MQRSSRKWMLVGLLLSMIWLSSCSSLNAEIAQGERRWNSQALQNYDIEVGHASGTWHYQIHAISVRDGVVVDSYARCIEAPMETALDKACEVQDFDPNDFTVTGLFEIARGVLERFPTESIYIGFDPEYGYPSTIRYDDPALIDEEQAWGVRSFEVVVE